MSRSEYQKALKQRNRLLSKPGVKFSELEFWGQQLSELGSLLLKERCRVVQRLNEVLSKDGLQIEYLPSPRIILEESFDKTALFQEKFQRQLKKLHNKERMLGFTLIGPQRDDWKLRLKNGQKRVDLGIFGSRGQQRMAIVKLKLAQLRILEQETAIVPVLLLDDVLSELDSKRQAEIVQLLDSTQTLITSARDPREILPEIAGRSLGLIML